MKWLLLIATLYSGANPVSTVETVEFASKAACDAARAELDRVSETQANGLKSVPGVPPYFSRLTRCVESGR